jgi:hypothetical protein
MAGYIEVPFQLGNLISQLARGNQRVVSIRRSSVLLIIATGVHLIYYKHP